MKKKLVSVFICIVVITCTMYSTMNTTISAKRTEGPDEGKALVLPKSLNKYPIQCDTNNNIASEKTQLSFAVFADTHIGARYQNPLYRTADFLDRLGEDLVGSTNLLDFAVHLGDIVHHNTGQVNGIGLPWYVNQYKNNLKAFLVSHTNLPFYCIIGNHDMDDYQMNSDDPHNLTKSLIDELSMNNPVYAMMYDGVLFLFVPELGYVTWTHPVEYEWIEYMTSQYPNTTTIILCHQAIEDTTGADSSDPYRGKQDMDWWATLFQNNPQIKMWINGHNHYLDWYVSNQSTGETTSIRHFGHEMVFSAPYSQMNWQFRSDVNRIVIYNITASSISTGSWENNGAGGNWVSDYLHSWRGPTTFDPNAKDWYSFPMFLQDNETQLTDMKILSPNITLQLIGTEPMELFFDSRMESPSSWANENILGFGNDKSGNVNWTNPGMKVYGPTTLTFPEKYPNSTNLQEDGRSGQLYHSFPMGTICTAVPNQTYNFTITARCISDTGKFTMNVSCCDWGTKSQYSVLSQSEQQVFSHTFGPTYETIYGRYTVPNNHNAWFLQGNLEFLSSTSYDVSLFSVKRERTGDITEDFHLCFSGHWYNVSQPLAENEQVNFSVSAQALCDHDGVMNFTAFIQGNRYGMVNLVYHEPILMGMNARFRVNNYSNGQYNLSLTKTISRTSATTTMIWNSMLFEKLPHLTEFLVRFLMKGVIGRLFYAILNKVFPDVSLQFKFFPFSTDPMYAYVNLTADDGSGMKHTSGNGNLWFSCHCPESKERYVEVTLPNR
jgi:predicted MPP superfamily phosphohydrolase